MTDARDWRKEAAELFAPMLAQPGGTAWTTPPNRTEALLADALNDYGALESQLRAAEERVKGLRDCLRDAEHALVSAANSIYVDDDMERDISHAVGELRGALKRVSAQARFQLLALASPGPTAVVAEKNDA